jgi:hypothetical protein
LYPIFLLRDSERDRPRLQKQKKRKERDGKDQNQGKGGKGAGGGSSQKRTKSDFKIVYTKEAKEWVLAQKMCLRCGDAYHGPVSRCRKPYAFPKDMPQNLKDASKQPWK